MSMTTNKKAVDKQALISKIKKQTESFDTVVLREEEANALLDELEAAERRNAELEARQPDLYLCRVTRNGEELYSPCGKDYSRGRGYIAAATDKGE